MDLPFGVIPTTLFVTPLAVLAALFPATFAGLARGLVNWRAFLVTFGILSTLSTIYYFVRPLLPDAWWVGLTSFTCVELLVLLGGVVWATRRHAVTTPSAELPSWKSIGFLAGLAVAVGLLMVLTTMIAMWISTGSPFRISWAELFNQAGKIPLRELSAAAVGLLLAAAYGVYRRCCGPKGRTQGVSAESVALGGVLFLGAVLQVTSFDHPQPTSTLGEVQNGAESKSTLQLLDVELWHESPALEQAMSGIAVGPKHIAFGGIVSSLTNHGGVALVNRSTAQHEWTYTEPGLKIVYCTPLIHDGVVYFGEGMHTDQNCRMFAVELENKKQRWAFSTSSHTEGTPLLLKDRLYFSAGDDGVYATDLQGHVLFHHPGQLLGQHIDTSVTHANGSLYFGSGYHTTEAVCVEAQSGAPRWTTPLTYRSFGQPLVQGNRVYLGTGTGNLTDDLSNEPEPTHPRETTPAGQVVCLNATTGKEVWHVDLPRSVHASMAVDGRAVYAACRDGRLYAFDRFDGTKLWSVDYGQPLNTGVTLASYTEAKLSVALYLATADGLIAAHDPASGKLLWSRDLKKMLNADVMIYHPPVWVPGDDPRTRELYLAITKVNRNNGASRACIVRITDALREE
jgi:outer membrane protein assembly factor BamB